jgi:ElaB/YqjD/DUF883 family membrane-anchored ribosome-binding protein
MESNKNLTGNQGTTTGGGQSRTTTGSPTGTTGQTTASATQPARDQSPIQSAYDTTKQAVSTAYDKTSQVLSNTYDQAMTYGKEHPGQLTLIAFGAGIGIGILLAASFGGGRSRTSRIAEPVVNALSQVALEFFR